MQKKSTTELSGALQNYPYVDCAIGGANKRNNVMRLEDYTPNGHADCFTTYLRFPETLRTWQKQNDGSVKGYRGAAKAVFFPADFDNEKDPNEALEDIRTTARRWEAVYELPLEALRVYFSGFKGFSVEIPEELFGGFEAGYGISERFKVMAEELLGDSPTADRSIYIPVGLWRTPNTKHAKSGLYKIPLETSEWLHLSLTEIKKLARDKRPERFVDATEFEAIGALVELWSSSKKRLKQSQRDYGPPVDTEKVISGVPKGERDRELYRLACKLRRADVPRDVAEALVLKAARNCSPPFGDRKALEKVASAYDSHPPGGAPRTLETTPTLPKGAGQELTDVGNAERFVAQHGGRVRWCPSLKSYLVWDGKRWARDDCEEVVRLAQETARSIHHEAASADDTDAQRRIGRWAVASQSASRINAMLGQARPHIAIRMDSLDADPWLFNCQNGTIDLRTGERQDHDPADLITKLAPIDYDPSGAADAPRFKQFLRETLVKDNVIGFVQRFAGYSLTGDTRERALAILWGGGKNGKSTLVELLRHVMGDYAQNTDVETVLAKKHQGVGNEIAALKGARLVSCAEVEKGRRLAESKVKQLTGSDTVTARYLFAEPFDFKPAFKLWMSTNNKPEIRGTDDAIWDRIRLIPFTQRFDGAKRDADLPKQLRDESAGVLAWLVEGCLAWQKDGLGEPEEVTNATAEYRSEMDSLAAFIDECCVIHKDASVTMARLYARYSEWCEKSNETAETKRSFGRLLTERGFPADRGTGNAPIRTGIGLRTDQEPPPDGDDPGRGQGNSGDDQVTSSRVTNSDEETDNTNARVTTVSDSYPSVTQGNSENHCKSPENVFELPSVTQKSTTYPMKKPREETFRKQGNYGNYGNSQNENSQDEEARLKAAGWRQQIRAQGDFWLSPRTGYAYARQYALEELDREERDS